MTSEAIRERLKSKTAGIAGCGGLGSNAAVALARVGVGKLILVDFDRVEASNLNRQYYFRDQTGQPKVEALKQNIHAIDPEVTIETHMLRLDPAMLVELFSGCDVIIEAFDTDRDKQMIIETVLTDMPGTYLISGQGLAGFGDNESIATRQYDKLFIIGDGLRAVSDGLPPLAPRVGVVANMQANLALELLMKKE
jgi:sulfur carrier protein ThiS adenylyltransferase